MATQPLPASRRVGCAELTARAESEALAELLSIANMRRPRGTALGASRGRTAHDLCSWAVVGLAIGGVIGIYVVVVLMLFGAWQY